jgi:hypothetical protein
VEIIRWEAVVGRRQSRSSMWILFRAKERRGDYQVGRGGSNCRSST